MSNSCFVKFKGDNHDLGIYLHWNGGRDSIEAFCEYGKLKKYNCNMINFITIVKNFFGGDSSIYLEKYNYHTDNGTYVLKDWNIIDRKNFDGYEQNEHDLKEMLIQIDESQPVDVQLGKDFLNSDIVNIKDLKIGDKVFYFDNLKNTYSIQTVIGIPKEKNTIKNGHNVYGIPYVDKYNHEGDYSWNINNYLYDIDTIRVIKK